MYVIKPSVVQFVLLSLGTWRVAEAFGVKRMSWYLVLPEVFREARFWFSQTSSYCPWGAIGLFSFLLASCCWWCGLLCGLGIASAHCRRFGGALVRAIWTALYSAGATEAAHNQQHRLAQYSRRGWCKRVLPAWTRWIRWPLALRDLKSQSQSAGHPHHQTTVWSLLCDLL